MVNLIISNESMILLTLLQISFFTEFIEMWLKVAKNIVSVVFWFVFKDVIRLIHSTQTKEDDCIHVCIGSF